MRTIRTQENRRLFIETLRDRGNVRQTCEALDLSRDAVYQWRGADPTFAAEWEDALDLGIESLEDEAKRRAFAGSDLLLIFLLKANRPDKYRERSSIDLSTTVKHDLRNVPVVELLRRLDQLRAEQGEASGEGARLIEGDKVVDMTGQPIADRNDC